MLVSPPLRIAFDARALSHPQPGGYKSYTASLLAALADLGDGLELTVYLDRPWTPGPDMQQPGLRFEVVPTTPRTVGMPLREQWRLPRRIESDRPSAVHFPCATAPVRCPAPLVVTIHDTIEFQPQSYGAASAGERLRRRLMHAYSRVVTRRAARQAAAIVTDSLHSRDDLVTVLGAREDRVHVVPLSHNARYRPLATSEIGPREEAYTREALGGRPLPERFLLALVSPSPRKHVRGLVQAYARLPQALRAEVGLVLVWSHDVLEGAVDALASSEGVAGQVRSLYGVSDDDLVFLYNRAEAFVFPSLYEGFGLPVLEAMACGTPVIASSLTSVPEVAGNAARIVDPRDLTALAAALEAVLSDPDEAHRLAEAGLAHAARFNWRRTAELTRDVYAGVVEAERRRAR